MHSLLVIVIGLVVGVLVGLMGIGGGTLLVPSLVYLLGFGQHSAQGTSLLMQLPPLGLGALYIYWRNGQVDFKIGWTCALGFLAGGYFGGHMAVRIPARELEMLFGVFLMGTAVFMWSTARKKPGNIEIEEDV